jgi:5-methylcytosine-specific restriction endonuclease McrA
MNGGSMSHVQDKSARWLRRRGVLATDAPPTWTDHNGVVQPTRNTKYPQQSAWYETLRATVFERDNFTCHGCGLRATEHSIADGYPCVAADKPDNGYYGTLVLDHVISLRNGGSNHPDNMQTLCGYCNSAKSGLVDSRAGGRR